jgi:flagellar hook-length control protein FliK
MRIVPDRDDPEREVMTSLPRTRPVRRSAKRGELATTRDEKQATTRATATAKSAKAVKPKKAAKSAAKPKGAKAKGEKAKREKVASNGSGPREPRRTPRPRPAAAAEPAAAEVRSTATAQAPPEEPTSARPPRADIPPVQPRRKVPAAGYAAPSARADETENAVADLVTTTVQAAQELAQIGIDVGRAAVRSMLDRLPRG